MRAVTRSRMHLLHTMLRVLDLDAALRFWCDALGMVEVRRSEHAVGRFTLVFLRAAADVGRADAAELELTWNWDETEPYGTGRAFGHVAVAVDDIHATCARLQAHGVTILRPPRDGRMAFVKSPDGQSVELLQRGPALTPQEPWVSMPNTGTW
jgi:lactoylglutathione lyase